MTDAPGLRPPPLTQRGSNFEFYLFTLYAFFTPPTFEMA